jgi:predicted MFS family arabinose efflux permease
MAASTTGRAAAAGGGMLAPLRRPGIFRVVWTANLVSALGTLIQGVGAAWLMTTIDGRADMVALVQTATLAPILLFALAGGVVADLFDRRRVLIVAQVWMAAVSALLAVLGLMGGLGPAGLLLLTFALGTGAALNGPAWQAAVREMVPREDLAAAVTLNAVAFNIARAVGPALGGVLIAALGAEAAFIVNAVSSLALIAAMLAWRRELPPSDLPRERLGHAMVTGLRYVQETPPIRAVLARGGVFGVLASAVMALLPLVARDRLGGDATLYGLLLGAFGVGALAGAFAIHPVRQARGAEFVVTALSAAFGAALLLLGLFPSLPVAAAALPVAGAAWLGSFSTFNIAVQMTTAPWVQARVLALYQTVVFGGMALGSWAWGHAAEAVGLDLAQAVAGGLLLLSTALHFRLPMPAADAVDLRPMPSRREDPKPAVLFHYGEGPVLVIVEYRVPAANTAAFVRAMEDVGHMRKRDGAWRWNLFQDTEDAQHWFETFTLESWFEYLRQRRRGTAADEAVIGRARALLDPGFQPVVRRMIHREGLGGSA